MEKTYLRRHEFRSAAESAGCWSIPHFFFAQSIIGNLDMAIKRQKNVIEFQISVYYTVLMEVFQGQADFCSIKSV